MTFQMAVPLSLTKTPKIFIVDERKNAAIALLTNLQLEKTFFTIHKMKYVDIKIPTNNPIQYMLTSSKNV